MELAAAQLGVPSPAHCYASAASGADRLAPPPSQLQLHPSRRQPAIGVGAAAAALQAFLALPGTCWGAARPRLFSTEELRILHPDLSEGQFHKIADAALDHLQEHLEAFVEDQDVEGGDVEYASGVLTVRLGRHGTYVINKQTPNRQIWLSSPVSGPFRYDFAGEGRWVYSRDGRELHEQLEGELAQLLGASPGLTAPQH